MTIRNVRALLLPIAVAAVAVAALAWYALLWIPAQQRFLNERNFRLLRTLGAQIEAKVNNFDRALDHAIDSTGPKDVANASAKQDNRALASFIRLFAPELDLLPEPDTSAAKLAFDDAGDPPRVVLQRDEGQSFLYLGLAHAAKPMVAKADLSLAVGKFLVPGDDFDSLLLVDRDGIVIDQHSPLGLELARVDQLARVGAAPPENSEKPGSQAESASSFQLLRMSNNSTDVLVGDVAYKLYVQPIELSLVRADAKRATSRDKEKMPDEPEEWALCGLVRADTFRASSAAISYIYLLWLSAGAALLLCAIPLLKLRVLSPRERLTRTDAVLIPAAAFVLTGLLVFIVFDVYYFGRDFARRTDNLLIDTAGALQSAAQEDIRNVGAQMFALNSGLELGAARPEDWIDDGPRVSVGQRGSGTICKPAWACRDTIFGEQKDKPIVSVVSPFVDLVNWSDGRGQQRIKWTTGSRLTPFINIVAEKVDYADALMRAQTASKVESGISALLSPNTGEMLTVFWTTLVPGRPAGAKDHVLVAESAALARYLPTFDHAVLPPHVQFAVVTRQGTVVYHSNVARSLKENFVQESQDDLSLRSVIASEQPTVLTTYYGGKRHRMYVSPLSPPPEWFGDPHWSLIVFQDATVAETVNLETLTVGVGLFALWGVVLMCIWGIAVWAAPRHITKWFWPRRSSAERYAVVAVINGAIAFVALVAIGTISPRGILTAAIVASIASTVVTYLVLTRTPRLTGDRLWRAKFIWARVTLLFVQAVVPAIACFSVAYDFETSLFVRDGQLQLAEAVSGHDEALRRRLESVGVTKANADTFVHVDTASGLRMFFDTTSEVVAGGEALTVTRLEALMRLFHRRYNALAIEPDAVSEGWTVRSEPSRVLLAHSAPLPSGDAVLASAAPLADANTPSVLLVLLLFGAVNVLVRRGVAPMFLLDIDPEPDSGEAAAGRPTVTNTLFVGVPGATELADRADGAVVHVYDVRTLATERLRGVTPVERPDPLRSPMTVGAIAGAIAPDWKLHVRQHRRSNWADAFEYGELPGRGGLVGFSHVDHRFDEAEFRGQTLALLEQVVYRHGCAVWLAAYRDPLERLADNDATAAERERWTQVLSSFSRRLVPTGMTHRQSDDAEPFYGAVWNACSTDEKVALRQIADEDVINPRNGRVVRDLVSKGLVRREGTFHVASGRLRQFILETSSARQTAEWEREGVTVPWATLSTTLAAVAFGLGGLLVFTQQQLFDAWVGFMPSLAPVLPTIVRWLAGANGGSKAGAAE